MSGRKLEERDMNRIWSLHQQGVITSAIATRMRLSVSTVRTVIRERTSDSK